MHLQPKYRIGRIETEGFQCVRELNEAGRARNFRVWVVGQAVAPTATTNPSPEVLSEVRKAFTVFVDPGERNSNGSIDSSKFKTSIIHENDF